MTSLSLLLEEQMQNERLARAQMALQRGEMRVQPINDCTWTVASKGSQYTVTCAGAASRIRKVRPLGEDTPWQEHQGLRGTVWTCTCPDFAGRCQVFHILCKHIAAVRFSETSGISETGITDFRNLFKTISVRNTEDPMNPSASSTNAALPETTGPGAAPAQSAGSPPSRDELIWRLCQPLDMNRVKRRQASGQGTVPYLEGYDVIEAANELFLFRWSFDLLSEPQIMRWDKAVTYYDQRARKKIPVLGEDGKPLSEVAGIVYITGKVTVELGGLAYSHADVGRCVFSGDTPEALDMALAGAATDCLKRCFRQLGEQFGLSLYDKEIARTAGLDVEGRGPSSETGAPRHAAPESPAAHTALAKPQTEAAQYRDGTAVEANNAAEVGAFNTFKAAHQGLAPASRDGLRAWSAGTNGKK